MKMTMDALAPWLDLLPSLGKLYRSLDDEGDRCVDADGVLWFHWTRAADASQWPRQLELLGLLSRLADADPPAFEALLSSLEDAYSQYFVAYRARYEAPYSVGVYVKLEDEDVAKCVLDQLKMTLSKDPESEFATATRAVEATQASRQIPVFVEVLTAVEAAGSMETTLQLIHEQLQYQQSEQPTGLFRVTVVQASHEDTGVVSNDSLVALGRLADASVRIPRVVIETSATVSTPRDAIVDFVTAIQSLLGVRGVASHTPPRQDGSLPPRLQHLVLRPPFSMHIVIALCTAIANSETLQRVSVEAAFNVNHGQPFPMEPFWRWLAYALFSRAAHGNVSMLEIDASLLLRFYVQGMQSVAQHEDALTSELDPRLPIPSPWKDSVVDVLSGTEISLVYDYGGGKDVVAAFTPATELQSLRVLQDDVDNGWLYAVLPGWGECRVPRDSVTLRTVQPTAEPDRSLSELTSPRGVRHVRLNYAAGGTLAATEAFLEMAGVHIHRLDIHEPESHDDDNIVAVLLGDTLRHCVNIKELDVFGAEIDSLDVMTDGIPIAGCRIQRIKLRQLTVRTISSVHRFFVALADPLHPLAQNLRDLSFHIIERTIEDQTRGSIFNSCVRMLGSNPMLRECRAITLSKQRAAKFVDKFDAFDGQRLPARKAPLALRSKLAFLSVVTETTSSALHAIDVNLLGNIFLLAAENEIRASSVEVAVTYERSSRG